MLGAVQPALRSTPTRCWVKYACGTSMVPGLPPHLLMTEESVPAAYIPRMTWLRALSSRDSFLFTNHPVMNGWKSARPGQLLTAWLDGGAGYTTLKLRLGCACLTD